MRDSVKITVDTDGDIAVKRPRMILNPNQNIANSIISRIYKNGGFCPCQSNKCEDTKCPCSDFISKGVCHCSLFVQEGKE